MTCIALAGALAAALAGAGTPGPPQRLNAEHLADAAFCAGLVHAAGRLQRHQDQQLKWLEANEASPVDIAAYNSRVDEYNGGLDALRRVSSMIQRNCASLRLSGAERAVMCERPVKGISFKSTLICQRTVPAERDRPR